MNSGNPARVLMLLATILAASHVAGQESESRADEQRREAPPLPTGLGEERDQPPLPSELGEETGTPPLPAGLDGDGEDEKERETEARERGALARFASSLTGFWDTRAGVRLRENPDQRATSLGETRLQLSRDQYAGAALIRLTADFVYDDVAAGHELQPEQGRGWMDLREAYAGGTLGDHADLRAGRQILTWGVGDLLFLNDLFPKDWNSFFTGRDVEYLKAPSDAVKLALFSDWANLDIVYTPKFDPDRFLDNRRLSLFDPRSGRLIGRHDSFRPSRPSGWFDDDEWAFRLHRTVGGWEAAAYGYRGFWKSPAGFDPVSGRPLFPELSASGGSLRGPVHTGIVSLETSWYRSRDDLAGANPFLPNSQFRFLAGYEQELVPDLMLGGQYYLERTLDFDALTRNLPEGFSAPDENRHLLTVRLTLLTHGQYVTWSLFTFASPSDEDAYLRGLWSWKATDAWTLSAGFNLFEGTERSTFFGQFEDNTNAYLAVRYGF
ncbi:MAG: hypothetical protein RQ847_05680 [Wenzhouxiangellaceae bacterium]|nr:hypothetical protein [Wenzhouxiangellaceae bacterium]